MAGSGAEDAPNATTTSLWRDREALETDHEPAPSYDDVIVGGGLTGLVTGLLLARAGRAVVVLEAREVGAGTTGNTTGKLSLLQGTKLSSILRHQSRKVAESYVEANREGQQWLLRFCSDHHIPFQWRDAVTYAADDGPGLNQARDEHAAAASLGLDVRWVDRLFVPFPHAGATLLAEQAQLDAMDVLAGLARQFRQHGGHLVENARVVKVSKVGEPTATLHTGVTIRGRTLVLATGTPILDRGLYFAKLEPKRSYALAFDHPDPPELMMLAAGKPSRSLRDAPAPGGRRLLVGGEGHAVGRARSEQVHLDRLRAWTATYYPDASETHAWSAQDYSSHDGVPFVGRLPRGGGRIFVATGYDKWGMTNAVAAGLDLVGQILGSAPSWAKPIHRRLSRPRGVAQLARINAAVGVAGASSVAMAGLRPLPSTPPEEGTGQVGRVGVTPVGRSTAGGRTCSVVALCTHLGGVLKWNDAEASWDCPLHGSRFSPTGEVLEGPATRPLRTSQDRPLD